MIIEEQIMLCGNTSVQPLIKIKMQEEQKYLRNDDGSEIALWKMTSPSSLHNRNILLTHGTFSNKKVLNGIVEYLTLQQYTCWVL